MKMDKELQDALDRARTVGRVDAAREIFEEIERVMIDIAPSKWRIGGVLLLREGTFQKANKDWQALKEKYLRSKR